MLSSMSHTAQLFVTGRGGFLPVVILPTPLFSLASRPSVETAVSRDEIPCAAAS
jgi:hypothetical protein